MDRCLLQQPLAFRRDALPTGGPYPRFSTIRTAMARACSLVALA